jgi:hypothetical protein
MAFSSGLLKMP